MPWEWLFLLQSYLMGSSHHTLNPTPYWRSPPTSQFPTQLPLLLHKLPVEDISLSQAEWIPPGVPTWLPAVLSIPAHGETLPLPHFPLFLSIAFSVLVYHPKKIQHVSCSPSSSNQALVSVLPPPGDISPALQVVL